MESSKLSRQENTTQPAKGKGKKTKRFLGQNDALELAASIAGIQEEKSLRKAEKRHETKAGQTHEVRTPRLSASKVKLKETKARLAAQRSRTKKDKAKLRKQIEGAPPNIPTDVGVIDTRGKPLKRIGRKSVSFA